MKHSFISLGNYMHMVVSPHLWSVEDIWRLGSLMVYLTWSHGWSLTIACSRMVMFIQCGAPKEELSWFVSAITTLHAVKVYHTTHYTYYGYCLNGVCKPTSNWKKTLCRSSYTQMAIWRSLWYGSAVGPKMPPFLRRWFDGIFRDRWFTPNSTVEHCGNQRWKWRIHHLQMIS